jgi:hypothetical protein
MRGGMFEGLCLLVLACAAVAVEVTDPETGNVYALAASGDLAGRTGEGKLLWERSLAEGLGLSAVQGATVEGELVIVGGITSGWGEQAPLLFRRLAFDKRTGETVSVTRSWGAGPARLEVTPTELVLKPGERVRFRARLVDDQGRLLREEEAPGWALNGLHGTIDAKGQFTAAEGGAQAGSVRASVGALSGEARVRVVPLLPWSFDFEGEAGVPAHWVGAAGRLVLRDQALVATAGQARMFMGSSGLFNYTVEADVLSRGAGRPMGDGGVVAQRYTLVLLGEPQRIELQAWPPGTAARVWAPFAWKPDTRYRVRLRVENHPQGEVRAFGKAWPVGEPEPAEWTLERVDPGGHRQGSPGLYADAPVEVWFDNVTVATNR